MAHFTESSPDDSRLTMCLCTLNAFEYWTMLNGACQNKCQINLPPPAKKCENCPLFTIFVYTHQSVCKGGNQERNTLLVKVETLLQFSYYCYKKLLLLCTV